MRDVTPAREAPATLESRLLRPIARVYVDESKLLMDVLSFEAGGQGYALPADEAERVLTLPDAERQLGADALAGAVDLDLLLSDGQPEPGRAERVIVGKGGHCLALVRGRVVLSRVYRTQLLPIPLLIRDAASDRGIVGIAVSDKSALFLLVSLLPFGGMAVPL